MRDIMVQVQLRGSTGHRTVAAVVDTGAQKCCAPISLMEEIGAILVGDNEVDDGTGRWEVASEFEISLAVPTLCARYERVRVLARRNEEVFLLGKPGLDAFGLELYREHRRGELKLRLAVAVPDGKQDLGWEGVWGENIPESYIPKLRGMLARQARPGTVLRPSNPNLPAFIKKSTP